MTTRPRSPGVLGRAARLAVAAALAVGGALALPAPEARADATASGDVIANLWSWNWKSVAAECTDVLGPAGYGAVWVAPPSESYQHPDGHWWDVYQPYSYSLNSRFGTATQFRNMIDTCHAAGVKVYTDAVINHTAAQTGTGYHGTRITDKYDTPDWDPRHYHTSAQCHDEDLIIDDWNNLSEVQNCELLGLPDLRTEDESVRDGIAAYLNSQLALGVDGFRVDAAKHMPAADVRAIRGKLRRTTSGAEPFVFQEVYPGPTPQPGDYFSAGDVLDFAYADRMKSAFLGSVSGLASLPVSGVLAPDNSVSFVTNHDTERNGMHLSYKDGAAYRLANLFQLAYPWSTPTVYSGFHWSDPDQGPPGRDGFVADTTCGNGWDCVQRDTAVIGMVKWHNAVGSAPLANWSAKSSDVIGFGRGAKGFFALNNGPTKATYTFATGLPDGRYANVVDNGATSVTVSGGNATLTIPARGAVAFHVGTFTPCAGCGGGQDPVNTVTATFHTYAPTTPGQDVYVTGSLPALGNWNTAQAVKLSSAGYPVWSGTVDVPVDTSFEFKFLKKDAAGNVIWESGANRTATARTSALTVDSSWNVPAAQATDVTFGVNAATTFGTDVYVVGSVPALGSWNPADAVPLSSASYPVWSRTVIVPKNTSFEYKYLKKDANGNVIWESGANRTYRTGGSAGYRVDDTWR